MIMMATPSHFLHVIANEPALSNNQANKDYDKKSSRKNKNHNTKSDQKQALQQYHTVI